MLELQKTLVMLTERKEKKKLDQRKRQENRKQKRREYEDITNKILTGCDT